MATTKKTTAVKKAVSPEAIKEKIEVKKPETEKTVNVIFIRNVIADAEYTAGIQYSLPEKLADKFVKKELCKKC